MEITSDNIGEEGWYEGVLQEDGNEYVLAQEMSSAWMGHRTFMDELWDEKPDEEWMIYGELGAEFEGTVGEFYLDAEDSAYVIDQDFDGWTVGYDGESIVFTRGSEVREFDEEPREVLSEWYDTSDRVEVIDRLREAEQFYSSLR
ncbi:MAG: hypothetical protein ABEK01_05175 [Candidatus Nanohaloarchaea archaeon]